MRFFLIVAMALIGAATAHAKLPAGAQLPPAGVLSGQAQYYDFGQDQLSAAEIYVHAMISRGRMDPAEEHLRQNAPGSVGSTSRKEPMNLHKDLVASAHVRLEEIKTGGLGQTPEGEIEARILATGYGIAQEDIFRMDAVVAVVPDPSGALSPEVAAERLFSQLWLTAGLRQPILNSLQRQCGIAMDLVTSAQGLSTPSWVLVIDMAPNEELLKNDDYFSGMVFLDSDNNGFYTMGGADVAYNGALARIPDANGSSLTHHGYFCFYVSRFSRDGIFELQVSGGGLPSMQSYTHFLKNINSLSPEDRFRYHDFHVGTPHPAPELESVTIDGQSEAGLAWRLYADDTPLTMEVEALGYNLTYEWWWTLPGQSETKIPGQTGRILSTSPMAAGINNFPFRLRVSNGNGQIDREFFAVSFSSPAVITEQPKDQEFLGLAFVQVSYIPRRTTDTIEWQVLAANGTSWIEHPDNDGDRSMGISTMIDSLQDRIRVSITNSGGTTLSDEITISQPNLLPEFSVQPSGGDFAVGDRIDLYALAAAEDSTITYQWFKDGNALAGETDNALRIDNAGVEDSGAYFLRASNRFGDADSNTVTVLVQFDPPEIVSHPADASVDVGSAHTFSVVATGENLTYQWQFLNSSGVWSNLVGATDASYTIAAVDTSDRGSYRVLVSTPRATLPSEPADLFVTGTAPVILTQPGPASQTVPAGNDVSYFVEAVGESPAQTEYRWYKNGERIPIIANPTAHQPTLVLNNAGTSDSGTYFCRVINTATDPELHTDSDAVSLTVTNVEISFEGNMEWPDPDNNGVENIDEGTTIFFRGRATITGVSTYTGPFYQWEFRAAGQPGFAPKGAEITDQFRARLDLENVTIADSGTYRLRARFIIDGTSVNAYSEEFGLTVEGNQSPPVILTHPQSTAGELDQGAGHVMSATWQQETSPVSYQWLKAPLGTTNPQGPSVVEIAGAGGSASAAASYQITAAEPEDAGVYFIRLTNQYGDTFSNPATVRVAAGTMEIVNHPRGAIINEGGSHTFAVTVEGGSGSYRYTWLFGGEEIGAPNARTFTVSNAIQADAGTYSVLVEDLLEGTSKVSNDAQLTVRLGPPRVVQGLPAETRVRLGDRVELATTIAGEVQRYIWRFEEGVGSIDAGEAAAWGFSGYQTDTLVIDAVESRHAGRYVLAVQGGLQGNLPEDQWPRTTLVVLEPRPELIRPLENQTVPAGGTASFIVEVSGERIWYEWYFRSTELVQEGPDNTLVLENVTEDQEGTYTVLVYQDNNGTRELIAEVFSEASLTVSDPPMFTAHPGGESGERFVVLGSVNTTLQSTAVSPSGATPLDYQWYLNGATVGNQTQASSNFVISQPFGDQHTGRYWVVATDTNGLSTRSNVVHVYLQDNGTGGTPPSISSHTQSQTAQIGGVLTFNLETAGGSVRNVRWFKDGVELPQRNASWSINSVTEADAGNYQGFVDNRWGYAYTDMIAIAVGDNVPFQISEQPQNILLGDTEQAQLSVQVVGASAPTFKWFSNAAMFVGAVGSTQVPGTDFWSVPSAFTVNGGRGVVVLGNNEYEGEYYAEVTDDGTKLTSAIASVNIGGIPPTITVQPELNNPQWTTTGIPEPSPNTPNQGATLLLQVTATGNNLQYQWFRNGSAVEGEISRTLQISPVRAEHEGAYTVNVTNEYGSDTSEPVQVIVNRWGPSNVSLSTEQVNATEGDDVAVTLNYTASDPSFDWFYLDPASDQLVLLEEQTTDTLTLDNIRLNQAGYYQVWIDNQTYDPQTGERDTRYGGARFGPFTVLINVEVGPARIIEHPTTQTVVAGESATFMVEASGNSLTYQWTFNGQNISGARSSSYTIPVVDDGDAGIYRVVVRDNQGTVVTSEAAELAVLPPPPTFDLEPSDVQVFAGEDAVFDTVVLSQGNFTMQWYVDGNLVEGATSARFTLPGVGLDADGTEIYVVATNSSGSTQSRTATLVVSDGTPIITQHPAAERTRRERGTVSFAITAEGPGELSYQWQKDGADLPGETGPDLILEALTREDAGTYTVVVSNSFGARTSNPSVLTVNYAEPAFLTQPPASVDGIVGESVELVAEVAPGADLTFSWRRDGEPLSNGEQPSGATVVGASSTRLTISGLTLDDAGSYRLVAQNPEFSSSSNAVALSVREKGPTILADPVATEVTEGGTLELTVEAESSGGALTYQWRKDGAPLSGQNDATLTISDVTLNNAGDYSVVVTDENDSVESEVAVVTIILQAPEIVGDVPAQKTILEGNPMEIDVQVTGTDVAFRWFLDDTLLYEDGVIGSPEAPLDAIDISSDPFGTLLFILETRGEHAGVYRVEAYNSGGQVSAEVRVQVILDRPRILTHPQSIAVEEGDDAEFVVEAEGSLLSFQWRRDGQMLSDLPQAKTRRLILRNVNNVAEGLYDVLVQNEAGEEVSEQAELDVTLRAPVVGDLAVTPNTTTIREGRTVFIEVEATGSGISYQWYHNDDGNPIPGATGNPLVLSDIAYDDRGEYFVVVSNDDHDIRSLSAQIDVEAAVPVITGNPDPVTVPYGSDATFTVEATGSALTYQWYFRDADGDETALPDSDAATLTIEHATFTDEGDYWVVVSNPNPRGAAPDTIPVVLTVEPVAPSITTQPNSLTVDEGQEAELQVAATGSKPLTFIWYRLDDEGNATPVQTIVCRESDTVERPHLVIPNASAADSGEYFVEVTNSENQGDPVVSDTVSLMVNTEDDVRIVEGPESLDIIEGEDASFTVVAQGLNLQYQWYVATDAEGTDATAIDGATSATLELTAVTQEQDGYYYVEVSNSADSETSAAVRLQVYAQGIWPGSVQLGDDWEWVDWFGAYNTRFWEQGWLVHADLGFIYVWRDGMFGEPDSLALFFWTTQWWTFTTGDLFPMIAMFVNDAQYGLSAGDWITFEGVDNDGRLVFSRTGGGALIIIDQSPN